MKLAVLFFLTLVSLNCLAAHEAAFSSIAGTYAGEVFNGGDLDPVVTTFEVAADGRLIGGYVVSDESGVVQGTVSSAIMDDEHTLTFGWTDKYGEGYASIVFSADFQRFDGFWGTNTSEDTLPWNGRKQ